MNDVSFHLQRYETTKTYVLKTTTIIMMATTLTGDSIYVNIYTMLVVSKIIEKEALET